MRHPRRADAVGAGEALARVAGDARQRCGGRGRLGVWCRDCGHQVEPDPGGMAERHGAEMTVLEWHSRLVCGSRQVEFVVTGTDRR